MSQQSLEYLKGLVEGLENAFYEIDSGILDCPDMKAFNTKFMKNIDEAIKLLDTMISNQNGTNSEFKSECHIDFINQKQYQSISK